MVLNSVCLVINWWLCSAFLCRCLKVKYWCLTLVDTNSVTLIKTYLLYFISFLLINPLNPVHAGPLSDLLTDMTGSRQSQKTNYIFTAHKELYEEIMAPWTKHRHLHFSPISVFWKSITRPIMQFTVYTCIKYLISYKI